MRVKKRTSAHAIVFAAVQLLLVFFYIRHQSSLIQLSYQRQKHEHKKLELAQRKRNLKHALQESHNLSDIKDFALQANMHKLTLDQIKTVPREHSTA